MQLIGTFDRARPRHRDGVIVARAALRRGQIVPAAALEEMRTFGQAVQLPAKMFFMGSISRPDIGSPLLEQDAKEGRVFGLGRGPGRDGSRPC